METLGRAGIAPTNQARTPSRNANEHSRWHEGIFLCGRAWVLTIIECCLGVLSSMRGRGRGLSPYLDTAYGGRGRDLSPPSPTTPHLPTRRGRGRSLPPPTSTTPHL